MFRLSNEDDAKHDALPAGRGVGLDEPGARLTLLVLCSCCLDDHRGVSASAPATPQGKGATSSVLSDVIITPADGHSPARRHHHRARRRTNLLLTGTIIVLTDNTILVVMGRTPTSKLSKS